MSFNSLRTLRQGEMTFSAFKAKARRLVQECQYAIDADRLLEDIIVTGDKSMTAYRNVVNKERGITLSEVLEVYKNEAAVDANLQISQQEMHFRVHRLSKSDHTPRSSQDDEEETFHKLRTTDEATLKRTLLKAKDSLNQDVNTVDSDTSTETVQLMAKSAWTVVN